MEPIAVTVEQACKLTNIGRDAMIKLMQNPRFPVFKIGNKHVIPLTGLKDYIEKLGTEHYGFY